MSDNLRQLATDVAETLDIDGPDLLDPRSPVLQRSAIDAPDEAMYLVGLIGGKEVGKSALVNALVGRDITPRSSHGPGTQSVIAYAHQSQIEPLRELLEREAPAQHRIVTHDVDALRRQVLLDLPDIDSHYAEHVELTRRMLRHMLFPLWMQSIEKYADQRPQELLLRVAAGNNPSNFVFCLNKADQLVQREGEAASRELAGDYAARLARALKLAAPPRVFLLCALQAERFDLPALRKLLSNQRSEHQVHAARSLAHRRQGRGLIEWIEAQNLPAKLESAQRLEQACEEEVGTRLVVPLLQQTIPDMLRDPEYRQALSDELMRRRVIRWPIVNILHVALEPLLGIIRRRMPFELPFFSRRSDDLVEAHLGGRPPARAEATPPQYNLVGRSLAQRIAGTFALLQQGSPGVARLYADNKLWEPMAAQNAEADLSKRLAGALEAQRARLGERAGAAGAIGTFLRWLITIGALLWFPIVQPLLEGVLTGVGLTLRRAVELLGTHHLLRSITFLLVYYVLIYLALRYVTQRQVSRMLDRFLREDDDPALSLGAQVLAWQEVLLAPARTARERIEALLARLEELKRRSDVSDAA